METTFIEKKRIPHNKISDEQISRIIELYKIHWNIDTVKMLIFNYHNSSYSGERFLVIDVNINIFILKNIPQ